MSEDDTEELTYAESGVDIDASEAATAALIGAVGESEGDYAGLLDIGDRYLALATDGVGTKLLVAEALSDYSASQPRTPSSPRRPNRATRSSASARRGFTPTG